MKDKVNENNVENNCCEIVYIIKKRIANFYHEIIPLHPAGEFMLNSMLHRVVQIFLLTITLSNFSS